MSALLLVILMGFEPATKALRDDVDVVELNHMINEKGQETLTQYIFWNCRCFNGVDDYYVTDWRLFHDVGAHPKGDMLCWFDRQDKVNRVVRGRVFRETVSLYDPEVEDRNRLPGNRRSGLTPKRTRQ